MPNRSVNVSRGGSSTHIDSGRSKAPTDAYRDNYDAIFGKKVTDNADQCEKDEGSAGGIRSEEG